MLMLYLIGSLQRCNFLPSKSGRLVILRTIVKTATSASITCGAIMNSMSQEEVAGTKLSARELDPGICSTGDLFSSSAPQNRQIALRMTMHRGTLL